MALVAATLFNAANAISSNRLGAPATFNVPSRFNVAAQTPTATATTPKNKKLTTKERLIRGAVAGSIVGLAFGMVRWFASRKDET
jgi:hypothetical protein